MNFFNDKSRVAGAFLAVFLGVLASPVCADDTEVNVSLLCDNPWEHCELTIGNNTLDWEGDGSSSEVSATWTLEKGTNYTLSISSGYYISWYEASVAGEIIILDNSVLTNYNALWDTEVSTTLFVPKITLGTSSDVVRNEEDGTLSNVFTIACSPVATLPGEAVFKWSVGQYEDFASTTNVYGDFSCPVTLPSSLGVGTNNLEVKFYYDGVLMDTDTQEIIVNENSIYTLSFSESGGSRNRKVSLSGLPMPGQKPQQDAESDYQRAETYVDAMTLGLVHDSKDVLVPLGSGQLALGVSRSLFNESWSEDKGLLPSARPDRPFGICWNASIGGSLEVVDDLRVHVSTTNFFPDYVNVADENGQSFRFLRTSEAFLPAPSSRLDLKRYQGCELSTNAVGYVFKKRFGTELVFEETESLPGLADHKEYTFCRVLSVTNAYDGVGLDFAYSVTNSLIPDTVTAFPSGKSLVITQQDGRIQTITDPMDHVVTYEYTNSNERLSAVEWPDDTRTEYAYEQFQHSSVDPKVVALASLTDSEDNTYEFTHELDGSVKVETLQYWAWASEYAGANDASSTDPDWGRLVLSGITLPDQETVGFEAIRTNGVIVRGVGVPNTFDGTLTTVVTDACGNEWSYHFTQPEIHEHPNYSASPAANHTVFYKRMEMVAPGIVGSEIFEYYADNMALRKTTDLHGNTMDYAYEDAYLEPVAQTNELDFVESYLYESARGMRKQTIDAENRKNTFVFDGGHRTQSKVFDASSQLVQHTFFEYGNADYPGFVTRSTVTNLALATDPVWAFDLVTASVPDANGMLWQQITDPDGLALTTTYSYDANNNQTRVIDANTHTNWLGYDEMNRLVAITNADLSVRSIGYDFNGNKVRETDENQNSTLFVYDTCNRLRHTGRDMDSNGLLERNGPDLVSSFTYNAVGSLTSTTDPRGLVVTNLYDALQRLTTTLVDPDNLAYETTFAYDGDNSGSPLLAPAWKPTTITDPRGYKTFAQYDGLYRPVQTQQEIIIGGETTLAKMGYDKVGNLRFTTNWTDAATSQETQIEYDALNRPIKALNPDFTETENRYTSTGLQWKSIDELEHETQTKYDHAGRPWKVIAPAVDGVSPTTETLYDRVGNVTNSIDPRLISTTFEYDQRNRKTHDLLPIVWDEESQQNTQPVIITTYDDVGNVLALRDARQNTTTNFYDAANRLTNSILPEVAIFGGTTVQPSTTTVYDKNSNPRFITDANEVVVQMQYDLLNRLTNTIDGELHSIKYGYDKTGNRTSLIDQNTNETLFQFDGLNRNIKTTYADTSFEESGYNWLGNRVQRTDAKDLVTDYIYDARNRLDFVNYNNGHTRDYVYDDAGNLLDVLESNNPQAAVHYTYDTLNRVKTETSVGITHHYKYDLSGNRTNALYGVTDRQVEWEYDDLNRIEEIRDEQGYTTTLNITAGQNLQTAIDSAAPGSLVLVGNGTYGSITLTNAITVKSANGPAQCRIAGGSPARCATLSNNARLIGFTLAGGTLNGTNEYGAGALVGNGCLIADCIVSNNVADGINAFGGGLFLKTGATAQNCLIENNTALDGGGVFCEKGGLVRNCTVQDNTATSIGGAGIFMEEGGIVANSILEGNTATNQYARGGGGLFFYNPGGKVNSSTIADNLCVADGGIGTRRSNFRDHRPLGEINHSILWNNTPAATTTDWTGTGNVFVDPSTVTSASGADLSVASYSPAATRTTQFKYDLNSNLLKRVLPNNVTESRTYNALNRLTANINTSVSSVYSVVYKHDAVGNLRQMDDSITGLHTIPASATWNWTYDASYRLRSENVDDASSFVRRTEFDWDPAGNRTAMRTFAGGSLASTTFYDPASSLNQMTGWTCGETNDVYFYDANGNRTNKTEIVDGASSSVEYAYDEDNRLLSVAVTDAGKTKNHTFAYDYRTRRIFRETPTEKTLHIFDGGLSVQEYDFVEATSPSLSTLSTESIRGEGMGGGVGGMVYSIRNGQLTASHSNHRGDVTARTDNSGSLIWFARYNAYGTRFHEFGATHDRQRGNTKDEEEPLGLSNQGMRWEDLKHGVWLTPDPIGYADGPNRYAYVHCNPINGFDMWGLDTVYIYHGGDNGRGFGTANGMLFKSGVDALIARDGGHPIDASSLADANVQLRTLVVDKKIVIDKIIIIDHGNEIVTFIGKSDYTYLQELGEKPVDPSQRKSAKALNELGQYVEPGGLIELYGCEVGKDGKVVQDYADIANRTVKAYKGKTFFEEGRVPKTTGGETGKKARELKVKENKRNPQFSRKYRGEMRVDNLEKKEKEIEGLRYERDVAAYMAEIG